MIPEDQMLIVQHVPALAGIPEHRLKLLLTSDGSPQPHMYGIALGFRTSPDGNIRPEILNADDPSTIYASLPIRKARPGDNISKLPHYPSYSRMSPEQRGIYLHWLRDISQRIEIGYVFVYYYGLERHLVGGRFEQATAEILTLRKHHRHDSFQHYSASAVVHACILRERMDLLQAIESMPDFDYFGRSSLIGLHYRNEDLTADTLLRIAKLLKDVNRRYIRSEASMYREVLSEVLSERYGRSEYPFAGRFSLEDLETSTFPVFANTSFPPDYRTPAQPDFLKYPPFVHELQEIFGEVHERVKRHKRSTSGKNKTKPARTKQHSDDGDAKPKSEGDSRKRAPMQSFQPLDSTVEERLRKFARDTRIKDISLDRLNESFEDCHTPDLTHALIKFIVKRIRIENLEDKEPLECHFFYMYCIRFYYRLRERKEKAYDHAKFFCQQQIRLTPKTIHAFLVAFGPPLPAHTGYQQLSIVYQKEKNYKGVIELCETAMKQGWAGDWTERIERAKKWLARTD